MMYQSVNDARVRPAHMGFDAGLYSADGTKLADVESWNPFDLPCPFPIIDMFDQWFEWHRLVHFEGLNGYAATSSVMRDLSISAFGVPRMYWGEGWK